MIKTKLTFAVQPKDAFAPKKEVMGKCNVKIVGVDKEPIENRSGFHCFTDLPAGEYLVETNNRYYIDQIIEVETDDLNPITPVVDVNLEPNPYYPFPKGITLLTGKIVDENKEPVVSALVEIPGDRSVDSDIRGKFLFYFKEFNEDEQNVKLHISKEGYHTEKPTCKVVKEKRSFELIELRK